MTKHTDEELISRLRSYAKPAARGLPDWARMAMSESADALQAAEARARAAEEALKEAADALAIEARANEMSANIMRDRRRTGGWEGAERTAAAFDRHGLKAAGIHAKILAALNAKKGSDQ